MFVLAAASASGSSSPPSSILYRARCARSMRIVPAPHSGSRKTSSAFGSDSHAIDAATDGMSDVGRVAWRYHREGGRECEEAIQSARFRRMEYKQSVPIRNAAAYDFARAIEFRRDLAPCNRLESGLRVRDQDARFEAKRFLAAG